VLDLANFCEHMLGNICLYSDVVNETKQHGLDVQRSRGCVWFGEPGRCAAINTLLGVLGTCTIADFTITIAMVWNSFGSAEKGTVWGNTHVSFRHIACCVQMFLGSEAAKEVKWKWRYLPRRLISERARMLH
jgi:hypothetical protein